MRIFLAAAVLFVAHPLHAEDLPKLPAQTMRLVDTVRGLAPEFSADLLLRLAASRLITEPSWKRELIEEAFESGGHAQLPYMKRGEPSTDTHTSRLYWRNGLDALSLQTRAVEGMLVLNPRRAREMFEEIATPQVPELRCKETGTPDLSIYYAAARLILDKTFTPEERENGGYIELLERLIAEMQSPAQVTGALPLVFEAPMDPEQRQALLARFAGVLDRINSTPRLFQAAAGNLMAHFGEGAQVLIPAVRSYIVRHERGPRCDDSRMRSAEGLPFAAAQFNMLVAKVDPSATRFAPIKPDEVKSSKMDGTYPSTIWWQSKRSKAVLGALQWLNHGNRKLPDSQRFFKLEERQSSDWQAHYLDTLKLIEGWAPEEEISREDWFGMASEAYALLAEKVPPGAEREAAFGRYLNFMESHYADIESHNLWFTQLHNLWMKDAWLTDRCMESKNSVISMYAEISKLK